MGKRKRAASTLPGQATMAQWLLRHKVHGETDSEPECEGLDQGEIPGPSGSPDPANTPSFPREEPEDHRSPPGVRRSQRVAKLRVPASGSSPLGSPCSQASVVSSVSLGESDDDDALDPDFMPTRNFQQQISDGGKNQYIYTA